MMRFLRFRIWKIIELTLIFVFLNHTLVFCGVGSVYFSFPDKWEKKKASQAEIKNEIEKQSGKRKRRKKSSPFRAKPKNLIDWRLSGKMLNRAHFDTVSNDSLEDTYALHSWYTVENKIKLPKYNTSGFVSFDMRYDLDGNGSTDSKFTPLLQEAYMEMKEGGFRIRLGRQNVTWGKLDDFTLLDIVNPQDYTEFIMLGKQRRKIPKLMAKLDFFMQDTYIESFFSPRFKSDKINFFGSDWAMFRYLKDDIEKGDYTQAVKNTIQDIRVEDGDELKNSLKNYELGMRVGGRSSGYDYSFYYMSLHDRAPALQGSNIVRAFLYNPTAESLASLTGANLATNDLKLLAEHNRMHVVGSDFETTVGQLGVRGEMGLFFSPMYLKSDFSLVEKSTLSLGLGVDHTTSYNFYCNLQFIEDIVLNYEDLYGTDQFGHLLVGTISKDFLRGRLVPSLYFGYNFTYKDSFINPRISYTWSGEHGAFIVTAGAFIFEGNPGTTIGRFAKNDLIYTEAEYKF